MLVEDLKCLFLFYNFVPSVCNNIESVIWYCDESDLNRELYGEKETELYALNREYDEWKVRLEGCLKNNELIDNIKINNPIMNTITDGDLTDVLNVDLFYDYFGKMNEFGFYGYNIQDSNLCVNEIDQNYICLLYTSRCV